MKKSLLLAGMLALTPACAHAAAVVQAPVGRVSVTNGSYAAVGAVGASLGYPAAAAGASYLTLGSQALTLDAVVTAVNAYTAMALANVRHTFNTTVSAEFFNPSTRPDVMAAVASLTPATPMPVHQRPQIESMRGPARRAGQAEQEPEAPSVDDIQAVEASAPRVGAESVRTQLTNLGGRIKGLPAAADINATLAEIDNAFTGRSPS